jgi:hypothetical protein
MKTNLPLCTTDFQVADLKVIVNHLTEFVSGKRADIISMINRKFEIADTLLCAITGLKYSSMTGWVKTPSYFNANHWQQVNELNELEYNIDQLESNNLALARTNKQLHSLIDDHTLIDYEPCESYCMQKWEKLPEKFIKSKVADSLMELQEILAGICKEGKENNKKQASDVAGKTKSTKRPIAKVVSVNAQTQTRVNSK